MNILPKYNTVSAPDNELGKFHSMTKGGLVFMKTNVVVRSLVSKKLFHKRNNENQHSDEIKVKPNQIEERKEATDPWRKPINIDHGQSAEETKSTS